ncbi:MAG TPA: AMP-binding protein, partial [Planctomycetota bacterium]|nr:AMP-binding protein [Planctomycetota bacterium]
RDYLQRGEVVCIFPEGEISRTGALLPFRKGIRRIAENTGVPIVPVHLDRVWGSLFSFSGGRFLLKWPKRAPYPVTVTFGPPLPAESPPHAIRAAVQDLGTRAWLERKITGRPLPLSFVRRARRRPLAAWLLGRARGQLARGRALVEALALARALHGHWREHERVALLFPPSMGGALAALAVALSGRTAVWLDPDGDAQRWTEQAERGGARVLVTGERWRAGRMLPPVPVATLEAARRARGVGARAAARTVAALGFGDALVRACGGRRIVPDGVAAVVFHAGQPVELTHGALGAQVAGLMQVLPFEQGDRVACTSGLHEALGQVVLWLCAARGLALVLPGEPGIGALARAIVRYAADVLVTEPGLLPRFVAGCRPGQLGSVRTVLSLGVDHDQAAIDAFETHFGVRPLAGLARADLGPIVTVGSEGYRAAGFYQVGARRGYVGHPLPGVRVKAVDPARGDLPPDEEGELWAAGPSLDGPGWRPLGLRGRVDADGYVGLARAPRGG